MKRKHLLLFDKTIARLVFVVVAALARLRPTKVEMPPQLQSSPRFVVIRPGGLGDAIMSIPFLRNLKRRFPASHVTLVCVTKNRAVFDLVSYHDDLIVLDDLAHTIQNLWRLHRMSIDVLFDLEPYRGSSSIVSWLSGARSRVGFDTSSRRRLYTHLVMYSEDSRSESENMLRQLTVLGLRVPSEEARNAHIDLTDQHRERARAKMSEAGLDAKAHFLVGVAAGALKPENQWVMSAFSSLIESILAEDERARVILLGSAVDLENTQQVLEGLRDVERVTNLVAKTSLTESLAILESCRILVACDGGVVHMASAVGCRTVSLWGPSVMRRFKPVGDEHIGIKSDYPCVPCVTRERLGEFPGCPYGRRCLKDIDAARVMDAYLLQKQQMQATANALVG
jgi:ADP-heptose:LPS heptosyltransferase